MPKPVLRLQLDEPENVGLWGEEVIPLNTGSPPFPVHARVKRAMAEAVERIHTSSYPPTEGLPELRRLVAAWSEKHHGLPWEADQVVVTYGAMQALMLAARYAAQSEPGAEVLLPAPFWFHFPSVVEHAGAVPVVFQTTPESGFKLTPEQLESHLGPKSRLLVLTQPGNPAGTVYSREELAALAAVIQKHSKLLVASDEVYGLLLLTGSGSPPWAATSPGALPGIAERVLTINSMSKNFAMSGLRVGWIGAAPRHLQQLIALQRFTTLGVNEVLQRGALAALGATTGIVGGIVGQLLVRRQKAMKLIETVPRFGLAAPESSYYLWVDVRGWIGCRTPAGETIGSDVDLAGYLLNDARVAVVTGTSCRLPGYFRITYAVSEATFALGVARISRSLAKLHCPDA